MVIIFSILVTIAVVFVGIELANIVAYGWFAGRNHTPHIALEVKEGLLSPFDFEIISTRNGFVSIVPISLISDYYYNPDHGSPRRVLRFTKLHNEITSRFQELQGNSI